MLRNNSIILPEPSVESEFRRICAAQGGGQGYPGTPSDHVFWNLPNLSQGDEIILTDSEGTTYTYAVSQIFEVSPSDMSVTAPTGGDVVSLQTCIEDYGDYWTPGPDWLVRYVVQAERV